MNHFLQAMLPSCNAQPRLCSAHNNSTIILIIRWSRFKGPLPNLWILGMVIDCFATSSILLPCFQLLALHTSLQSKTSFKPRLKIPYDLPSTSALDYRDQSLTNVTYFLKLNPRAPRPYTLETTQKTESNLQVFSDLGTRGMSWVLCNSNEIKYTEPWDPSLLFLVFGWSEVRTIIIFAQWRLGIPNSKSRIHLFGLRWTKRHLVDFSKKIKP